MKERLERELGPVLKDSKILAGTYAKVVDALTSRQAAFDNLGSNILDSTADLAAMGLVGKIVRQDVKPSESMDVIEALAKDPKELIDARMPYIGSFLDASTEFVRRRVEDPKYRRAERKLDASIRQRLEANGVSEFHIRRDLLEYCTFVEIPGHASRTVEETRRAVINPSTCKDIRARIIHFPRLDLPHRWICFDIEDLVAYVEGAAAAMPFAWNDPDLPDLLGGRIKHPAVGYEARLMASARDELFRQREELGEDTDAEDPLPFDPYFSATDIGRIQEWYAMWKSVCEICANASQKQIQQMIDVGARLLPSREADRESYVPYWHQIRGAMQSSVATSWIVRTIDWIHDSETVLLVGYIVLGLVNTFLCVLLKTLVTKRQAMQFAWRHPDSVLTKEFWADFGFQLLGGMFQFLVFRLRPIFQQDLLPATATKMSNTIAEWINQGAGWFFGTQSNFGKTANQASVLAKFINVFEFVLAPRTTQANATLGWTVAIAGIGLGSLGLVGFLPATAVLSLMLAGGVAVATWFQDMSALSDVFTWLFNILYLSILDFGYGASAKTGIPNVFAAAAGAEADYAPEKFSRIFGPEPPFGKLLGLVGSLASGKLATGVATMTLDFAGKWDTDLFKILQKFLMGDVSSLSAVVNTFFRPELLEFLPYVMTYLLNAALGNLVPGKPIRPFVIPPEWKKLIRTFFVSINGPRLVFQVVMNLVAVASTNDGGSRLKTWSCVDVPA